MVRQAWYPLMALLMAASVSAGCLSGSPGPSEGTASSEVYRFTDDDLEPASMEISGTVQFTDTLCPFPVGCIMGNEERWVDLKEILPTRVPLLLEVTLTYGPSEPTLPLQGPYSGSLRADGAWMAEPEETIDPGIRQYSTTVFFPDESATIRFLVHAYSITESTEADWHVQAAARPLVHQIPEAFPVAFEVPDPQEPPHIRPVNETHRIFLWGPDDRFLGSFKTTRSAYQEAIKAAGATGTYVLYAPDSENQLTISVTGERPEQMTVLELVTHYHDWHASTLEEPARWSFDLPRVPIETGIAMRRQAMSFTNHVAAEGTLDTPDGKPYQYDQNGFSSGGGSPAPGLPREIFSLDSDDEGHVPGTYHATFVSNGHGYEATHYTRDYVRP